MSNIIDRRLNPRDKALRNRQKFIQRSKSQIKQSVKDAIDSGSISDIEGGKVRVKVGGIGEPSFSINQKTGNKKYVLPGNKDHVVNDIQDKSEDGEGSGGSKAGLGEGEDDFEFELNREEFLDFIFDDLELPDLAKKQMKDVTKIKMKRAGFTNSGNPTQLDISRSVKNSMGRRIGLGRPKNEEITELEELLETIDPGSDEYKTLTLKLEELRRLQVSIPWLDPFDVRYRNFTPTPQPMTQAVMFCVMDVSGSMGQREKDHAKRFFLFLFMFLSRKYQKVNIVFIRHHESAKEVDEEEFFSSKESGGTVVSTALELTKQIIDSRYNVNDWNIYAAQASDGDNFSNDTEKTLSVMRELLPLVQYFAYVEITNSYQSIGFAGIASPGTDLWKTYRALVEEYKNLNMRKVSEVQDVWKVFKDLFKKESA